MSTKYIASNWRLPNQKNSSKSDNYGLTFDGSELISQSITKLNSTTAFSISFWGKLDSVTSKLIVGDLITPYTHGVTAGWDPYLGGIFIFRCQNGTTAYLSASFPVDTDWHHFVVTYNAGTRFIYIDNSQAATDTTGPASMPATLGDTFKIGQDNSGGQNITNGSISEVAVFDYALSATQISTLYGSSSLGAGNPMALKPQPVAYYPLGDNSSGNPLTQPNEAVEDASVFDFDYSNSDAITLGNTIGNGFTQITCSIWVKLSTTELANNSRYRNFLVKFNGTALGPFELRGNYARGDSGNNKLFFRVATDTGSYGFTDTGFAFTEANRWYHIVGTYDGSNVKTFVDGIEKSTISANGTLVSNSDNATIGFDTSTGGFDGEMSNAQIWNTALSSTEIETLYNSGVPLLTGTQPQASNLKAWYKLDQSANWDVSSSGNWTIPDASGNGNDGTSSGMTSANLVLSDLTRNLPYDSYSFNFDSASSDSINTNQTLSSSYSALTLSAWVKYTTISDYTGTIFGQWIQNNTAGSTIIVYTVSNKIQVYYNSSGGLGSLTGTTTLSTGTWYNVVLRFDGSTLKLYIDGSEEASGSLSAINNSASNLILGAFSNSGQTGFMGHINGKISSVSIFNQALTSTELMKLYANGVPQDLSSFSPQPVAWYTLGSNSFWNGSAWTVRDMIGSNDGTGQNIGVDGLVGDSPRSSANGVGTNNSIPENLEGSTKWSDNNSWSINMSSEARTTDVP